MSPGLVMCANMPMSSFRGSGMRLRRRRQRGMSEVPWCAYAISRQTRTSTVLLSVHCCGGVFGCRHPLAGLQFHTLQACAGLTAAALEMHGTRVKIRIIDGGPIHRGKILALRPQNIAAISGGRQHRDACTVNIPGRERDYERALESAGKPLFCVSLFFDLHRPQQRLSLFNQQCADALFYRKG